MGLLAAQWVVAFSALVAASAVCYGVYSIKETAREFLAHIEETEARSRLNRHTIRDSECVQIAEAPLSLGEDDSA